MLWTWQLSTWTVASWLGWSLSCIWAACWSTASVFCLCIPAACGATWVPLLHWPTSPGNLRLQLHFKLWIYLKEDGDPTPVCLSVCSSCCVGVEPGPHSETFHRLFLPSVVDALLSLAAQLVNRAEVRSLIWWMFEPSCSQIEDVNLSVCVCVRMCLSSGRWWTLSAGCSPLTLTSQRKVSWLLNLQLSVLKRPTGTVFNLTVFVCVCLVLSSIHYEQIQVCDDVTVSLLCVQMWIQTCTANR